MAAVRFDSLKCVVLSPGDVPSLSGTVVGMVKDDDQYLVQAQLAAPGSLIVTTDVPLMAALDELGHAYLPREEFLRRTGGIRALPGESGP